MNTYGELDPNKENRLMWSFKGAKEHVVTRNSKGTVAYPEQQFDVPISGVSADASIAPKSACISFNFEPTSKDKNLGIVDNLGRCIVEKKSISIGGVDIETLDNADVYDTYVDLYMDKHVKENALLQGIQDADGLRARIGSKKSDGTAFSAEQVAIGKTLGNRFCIPLDFAIFNNILNPSGIDNEINIHIVLASASKVLLATGDPDASYKITNICLEFDKIIDMNLASSIRESYDDGYNIPFDKVTRVRYDKLSKKEICWPLTINSVSAKSLRGILVLFVDYANERKAFECNNKFYNPTIKKILVTTGLEPNQFYKGGILPKDYYIEASKYFDNTSSSVSWAEYLTTKFGLWIDFRSSSDNFLHGSGRTVCSSIMLQIDKVGEASGDLTCYTFSIADEFLHIIRDGDTEAQTLKLGS